MSNNTTTTTPTADEILQRIREGARKGGLARSKKKQAAARRNIKLANAKRAGLVR